MARALKPHEVGEVTNSDLGVRLPLMFDRNKLDFYVNYGGETVRAATAEEVKRLGRSLIARISSIIWRPVIHVPALDTDRFGRAEGLKVAAERYYLGETSEGHLRRCEWSQYDAADQTATLRSAREEYGEEWGTERPIVFPVRSYERWGDKRLLGTTLEYTPELWAGLCRIREMIDTARKELAALLSDPAGLDRVAQVGAGSLKLLLGAGEQPVNPDEEENEI